jgi:hypothetical protein
MVNNVPAAIAEMKDSKPDVVLYTTTIKKKNIRLLGALTEAASQNGYTVFDKEIQAATTGGGHPQWVFYHFKKNGSSYVIESKPDESVVNDVPVDVIAEGQRQAAIKEKRIAALKKARTAKQEKSNG